MHHHTEPLLLRCGRQVSLPALLLVAIPHASAQPTPGIPFTVQHSVPVNGKLVRAMAMDPSGGAVAAVSLGSTGQAELLHYDIAGRKRATRGLRTPRIVWGLHFVGDLSDIPALDGALCLSHDVNQFAVYRRPTSARRTELDLVLDQSNVRRRDYSDMSNSNAVGLAMQRGSVGVTGRHFCAYSSETVTVVRTRSFTVVDYVESPGSSRFVGCDFSPGPRLVVASTSAVQVRSLGSSGTPKTALSPDPLLAMAVNQGGDALAVVTAAYVQTYALPDLRPGLRFRLASPIVRPVRLAYLADGKLLLVGRSGNATIHPTSTGAVAATVKSVKDAQIFASVDGRTIAHLHTDGTIKVLLRR